MLERLLREVATRGTVSSASLARSLGISEALAESMVEALRRMGYLRAAVGECAASCDRCPVRGACLFGRQARIWMLGRKGERLLARRDKPGP
jgi:hypothetical protein